MPSVNGAAPSVESSSQWCVSIVAGNRPIVFRSVQDILLLPFPLSHICMGAFVSRPILVCNAVAGVLGTLATVFLATKWTQKLEPKRASCASVGTTLLKYLLFPPAGFLSFVRVIVQHVKYLRKRLPLEKEIAGANRVLDAALVVVDPPLPPRVVDGREVRRGMDDPLPDNFVPNRHYIGWLCNEAKAKFGLPKRTEANYLMVRRWVRDQMEERKMRPQHMVAQEPYVTSFVFVPSPAEIGAKEMLSTSVVVSRIKAMERDYMNEDGVIQTHFGSE